MGPERKTSVHANLVHTVAIVENVLQIVRKTNCGINTMAGGFADHARMTMALTINTKIVV